MEWFEGEAHEAISAAKSFGALLLVVVYDDSISDPSSGVVLEALDSPEITSRTSLQSTPSFYNFKLKKDSVSFKQFSEVYPVFVIPSIYIIDASSGKNLDIICGVNETKSQIIGNILKSLNSTLGTENIPREQNETISNDPPITRQSLDSPRESSSGSSRPNQEPIHSNQSEPSQTEPSGLSERVERAQRLLAERKAKREAEESEEFKRKEHERREVGKSLTEQKKRKEEIEIKEAMDERAKDKENDRLALEKVRAQIAQDREEKAARFAATKKAADDERDEKIRLELLKKAQEAEKLAAQRSTLARIQFRYPDGRHTNSTFEANAFLQSLFEFVDADPINVFGAGNYTLSSSFPTRQLDKESRTSELKTLGLAPSATVMVFPKAKASGSLAVLPENFGGLIALLLTPLTVIWGILMSFFGTNTGSTGREGNRAAEKRQAERSEQESQSKRPNTALQRRNIRREGNVARLGGDESDSDERNTYNGNSTQQM